MDNYLYTVGGQTSGSRILDNDMLEINLRNFSHKNVEVKNKHLMPALTNQKSCQVFYPSRYEPTPNPEDPSNVTFKRLQAPVNWSEAEHNIKYEGVYFFGGLNS
jgi:hypothetical protein